MASSQHRRVFVGNIPYDATEEQIIEICREVGPVVSFRLVIDRETGKPKGYGFCEYKDEETALSACRNLQGYEINGRQLRVDFAENDKNTDKNRERGRAGPGLAANVGSQKQGGLPVNQQDLIHNQPIGVHLAVTASMVMAGALGGPQAGMKSNQCGLQSRAALGYDLLTSHLANMSRSHLTEIMSELKMMATKDKDLARQLLLSRPQLSKALFQAQIMLNMVTPQVLQMPNLQQPRGQHSPGQSSQQPELQTTMQLPSGVVSASQEVAASKLDHLDQNKVVPNQFTSSNQLPIQLQQNPDNHALLQNTVLGQSSSMLPSTNLQSLLRTPSLLPNQPGQDGAPSMYSIRANNVKHSPLLPHPPLSEVANNEQDRPPQYVGDANWIHRNNTSGMLFGSANKHNNLLPESPDTNNRSSKLILGDGSRALYSGGPPGVSIGLSQVFGFGSLAANAAPNLDLQHLQQQSFQTQLPPEVQFALLQQVLSLTPEQLSSLPPEQQQLVIQLQEAIRRDQIWPSQPY